MVKINKLTDAQIAQIPIVRDRFLRIGISTAPADFEAAEQAAKDAYVVAGLPAPKIFIRLASPREGAIAAAILKDSRLGPEVRAQVRAQVWDQVGDQVRDQVWAQVGAQVWAQVGAQVGAAFYGQHEAGWLSFMAYFADVCGVDFAERLSPLTRLAENCGWCWFFAGAVVLTDRPAILRRNGALRLHCEDGPALQYRDGFAIYAWHGYRLPPGKEWIISEKARLTPDAIDAEGNAELRRIMLEVFGFDRYIEVRGAKEVSADELFGRPRRLLSMRVGGEEIRVLDVLNGSLEPDGSRRRFFLGAMRGANTPHEAVAMSYGIDPKVYSEGVRS